MKMTSVLARACAVTALCVASLGVAAGTASAMPISTIKSDCNSAGGRFWADYSINAVGQRYVTGYNCGYTSINGNYYIDYYVRYGNYRATF